MMFWASGRGILTSLVIRSLKESTCGRKKATVQTHSQKAGLHASQALRPAAVEFSYGLNTGSLQEQLPSSQEAPEDWKSVQTPSGSRPSASPARAGLGRTIRKSEGRRRAMAGNGEPSGSRRAGRGTGRESHRAAHAQPTPGPAATLRQGAGRPGDGRGAAPYPPSRRSCGAAAAGPAGAAAPGGGAEPGGWTARAGGPQLGGPRRNQRPGRNGRAAPRGGPEPAPPRGPGRAGPARRGREATGRRGGDGPARRRRQRRRGRAGRAEGAP